MHTRTVKLESTSATNVFLFRSVSLHRARIQHGKLEVDASYIQTIEHNNISPLLCGLGK